MPSSLAVSVLLSSGGSVIDLDATLFVQMGVFFCAFFILKFLVFRPVMDVFDARDQATGGAKEDAARMETEAAEKRAHFEGELRKVSPEPERTGRRNITLSPKDGTPVVVTSREPAREPLAV